MSVSKYSGGTWVVLCCRFGVPDPWLKRDYDMKLKLRMSSVRYTHTNKFQMEILGFAQHFLQLQDVLGRMRAASAGKKVNMFSLSEDSGLEHRQPVRYLLKGHYYSKAPKCG